MALARTLTTDRVADHTIRTAKPAPVIPSIELDPDACWQAVVARDRASDGAFIFAVQSTGIFCRPSCSARRPRRDRVSFHRDPGAARAAGFRPCLRCHPEGEPITTAELELVRRASQYLEDEPTPIPAAELAREVGTSSGRLERTFRRLTGVSPREYGDAVRVERFKRSVRASGSVTDALYDAGYGSSSRLYERSDALLGMTPAAYGRGGAGTHIRFATLASPAGRLLVAVTDRGISSIALGDDDADLEMELRSEFPLAELRRDQAGLAPWLAEVVAGLDGARPLEGLPVDVRGTAFQRRVWQALRRIPAGETRSYTAVARQIGAPRAVRAVASACARNPVPLAVPCHRVVREDGTLGGYRYGLELKRLLLSRESERLATGRSQAPAS
jgi:AraC family transcriptional regulator, regulatory protein of adaptative response / methylated-DNA-[protein]-cysteine methyltransferase